jgi:hypothetical protein
MPDPCRRCGCDDLHACLDDLGRPCAWVEPGLCSACSDELAWIAAVICEANAGRKRLLRGGGDAMKRKGLEAKVRVIVQKIAEAEEARALADGEVAGGFRLYHEEAVKELLALISGDGHGVTP